MARARAPLPQSAPVVIIGGGVIGTSCAFHLAEAGVRDVVLVERGTARLRLQQPSRGRRARAVLRRDQHPARPEEPRGVRRVRRAVPAGRSACIGSDICSCSRARRTSRRSSATWSCRTGLECRAGSSIRETVRELCSPLRVDDVLGGAFSPSDGHATPDSVVQGYAAGARALGAHLETDCDVRRARPRGRRDPLGRHEQGSDRDGSGRVRGRGVVAGVRRDGRASTSR